MDLALERAAFVALLQDGRRPWRQLADAVAESGLATPLLEQEHGLLAGDRLELARAQIEAWRAEGMHLFTTLDPGYPENLSGVHDAPPLIFVAGRLSKVDVRSVAVVGARDASAAGLRAAQAIAVHLCQEGFPVVSGLARGIDTAAHHAALEVGGRTIAVIGTGLRRVYPPENADLQARIGAEHAVVSQFWPDSPPHRRSFPLRNAVMSGISLATVVVEASPTSGARLQARLALGQGRTVFLLSTLLKEPWAQDFARRPGTYVVHSPREITAAISRLTDAGALIG
ncbi:MAG: DNA-processing protein DprA [Solirubrobacteraceae bacterium]